MSLNRQGDEKAINFGDKDRCFGAVASGDLRSNGVMIRIALFNDGRRFSPGDVNTFMRLVEDHMIVKACARKRSHHFARVGVENSKRCWSASGGEATVTRFGGAYLILA